MELIEWIFIILTFIVYYFFIGEKANKSTCRLIGWTICLFSGVLMTIYCFSINSWSLFFVNLVGCIFSIYAVYECYKEIKPMIKNA